MKLNNFKMAMIFVVCFFINSVSVLANENDWKNLYVEYIKQVNDELSYESAIGISEPKFKLIYIDDDNIPELYVLGNSTASGDRICTYYDGKLTTLHLYNWGLSYIEKKNLFCDSGGQMDVYYDYVYKIENGKFVQLHKGNYGAEDNSNVQWDEINNEPIYKYYWNEVEVSKEEYAQMLSSVFNKNNAIAVDNAVGIDEIIRQISVFQDISQNGFEKPISIILNGNKLSFNQPSYIENGTSMVPMRAIFEALGAEVKYNSATKTITAQKDGTIIELVTGSSTAKINGRPMTLVANVENKNGYTMVPLRFVSEALGAEVNWNGESKTITINQ